MTTYPDGKTRTVDALYVPHIDGYGKVQGCFALVHDITEHKVAEAALRASETLLRTTLRSVVEGRIIESFSPAAERMFGYAAEEAIGRSVKILMPEPDRGKHGGYIWRYLETGEAWIVSRTREVTGRRKDGTTFTVLLPRAGAVERGPARAKRDIPRGRERILLIDDEAAIARSEARLLERLGCRVEAATRSIGALEAFRAAPEEFDLVITAQAMRELSGMVLAREILKVRGDIPIILRSGFADALGALDAEEAVAAADGRAGVARYRESRADVVITDTFMPETDGLETIQEIRREFLQARIIAISGGGRRSNFDYLPSALMLGARRTMDNPFSPAELLKAVAEALEESGQNSGPAQT